MKDVYFKNSKLKDKICSSKEPSYFEFEGVSTKPLKIISSKCSCGCTTPIYPEDINNDFKVILKINKEGQSGNFNQSCSLTFSNGETEIIYVTGKIE